MFRYIYSIYMQQIYMRRYIYLCNFMCIHLGIMQRKLDKWSMIYSRQIVLQLVFFVHSLPWPARYKVSNKKIAPQKQSLLSFCFKSTLPENAVIFSFVLWQKFVDAFCWEMLRGENVWGSGNLDLVSLVLVQTKNELKISKFISFHCALRPTDTVERSILT